MTCESESAPEKAVRDNEVSEREIPWNQIGIEAIAIVVSILLAFAIDAWWDGRQQRSLERQYLTAIRADVEYLIAETQRTYDGNVDLNVAAQNRIELMLKNERIETEFAETVLSENWVSYRTRANLDSYSDLLSTGGVSTLRNQDVRLALAALRAAMDFEQSMWRDSTDLGRVLRPDLHRYIETNQTSMVAYIESDMIRVREISNARKLDVIAAGNSAVVVLTEYLGQID